MPLANCSSMVTQSSRIQVHARPSCHFLSLSDRGYFEAVNLRTAWTSRAYRSSQTLISVSVLPRGSWFAGTAGPLAEEAR